ncbi:hypothetical protein C8R43DRAFT_524901 [Mycena crocata]|nr:hypothetical protein C8R43DRAFT_524901 [Mycena crocata]
MHGIHQIKHCGTRKNRSGGVHYMCRLTRCSAKLHDSIASLKAHIELSHLKHLPLPCPFTNCDHTPNNRPLESSKSFNRSQDLAKHLEESHTELMGQELDVCSPLLRSRWEPCPPTHPMTKPPPLPLSNNIRLGGLFVAPIVVRPTARLTRLISNSSTSLPPSHAPKRAGRRKMLHTPAAREESPPNSHRHQHEFPDLPDVECNRDTGTVTPTNLLSPPNFVVRATGGAFPKRDLVRPLPMREMPLAERPPPPTSLFYEKLREQVYGQYAEGETAAADVMVPKGK